MAAFPLAALLDGWREPLPGFPFALMWIDLVAAACLGWAALQPGAWRKREQWSTPFDGLVLAMLALAGMGTLGEGTAGSGAHLLRQTLACAGAFYGLGFVLRRTPGSAELVWRALACTAAALGAHATWAATGGLAQLSRQAESVDARWSGSHGLAGMLAFATVALAGRASEWHTPPQWRLAFLAGAAGLAVHAAVGGLSIDTLSLARLDEPLDFSATCVTWLMTSALTREVWALRKERPVEAWRWRALAAATAGLGAASVFVNSSGGEGVRALAVLAAAASLAAPAEAEAARSPQAVEEAPLARAA